MCLLIESIYLSDGVFRNLNYHQARVNRTRLSLFSLHHKLDIQTILSDAHIPKNGLYKCRFVYNKEVHSIEFIPYTIRPLTSLKLVVDNEMEYQHKYKNRSGIERLFSQKENCDDVLIIKNGMVTDTSYANIIFKSDEGWVTPLNCLLEGTMRGYLIDQGIVKAIAVSTEDIFNFESFKIVNAMVGMDAQEVSINNIFI